MTANLVVPRTTVIIRKKSTGNIRRRVLDEEGFIKRAACVCVNEDQTKILLVSSKKDVGSWLVPGGGIEAFEEEEDAARREAWEEAGVRGRLIRRLGQFETVHPSGLKKHRTSAYLFVVSEEYADFPEAIFGRRRRWFSPEDAYSALCRDKPLQTSYLEVLHSDRCSERSM